MGLRRHEEARISELQKAIETIYNENKRIAKYNLKHYNSLYNTCLFVLLMHYDMSVLVNYYYKAYTKSWERKLLARQIAVILYEAEKDIPNILGKDYRASLKKIPLWDGAEKELNKITKDLNQFKVTHSKMLGELRNCVTAHRDADAIKQMEIIDTLTPDKIIQIADDFNKIINPLLPFMTQILQVLGKAPVMIHHLSERDKHRAE